MCNLNHQVQGWMEKTNMSVVLRLAELFYVMSLGKTDVSCFKRMYIGCKREQERMKQGKLWGR